MLFPSEQILFFKWGVRFRAGCGQPLLNTGSCCLNNLLWAFLREKLKVWTLGPSTVSQLGEAPIAWSRWGRWLRPLLGAHRAARARRDTLGACLAAGRFLHSLPSKQKGITPMSMEPKRFPNNRFLYE